MSRKGKPIVRRRTAVQQTLDFDYSIKQAFDYFVNVKKNEGVRERTLKDYHLCMTYFLEWLDNRIENINDITTATMRKYITYLQEERVNKKGEIGLSPYTVNIRIRFFKVFFNTLKHENVIDENPMQTIKLVKTDSDTMEPLTDKEIQRLLNVPNKAEFAQFRDYVAMCLLLDTGMRVSEVFSLEVSEVDFKSRTIYLPASKSKNRKPRVIPISNQVTKLLLELVNENRANFETNFVFVSNCGTPYQVNSFRRRLLIYKEKAGIEKRVSPHVFRHEFCRKFILNGGDIFTLQRIVGHADISTTRKYIQMDNETLKEQHAQFSPFVRLRK